MLQIPINHKLEGKVIDLRTPQASDYSRFKEILNDKETMEVLQRYFNVDHWSDEMVRDRYESFSKQQAEGKSLTYAIVNRATKTIVGNCGFKNIDPSKKSAEFGIIIHKSAWGTGAAKECHFLCLEYGFSSLRFDLIYFVTDKQNVRMRKFFDRINIGETKTTAEGYIFYELKRASWPSVKENLEAHS